MKIFAKRKRKSSTPAKEAEPRSTFASDPVVEELLKKDPSEWNAKERRMVKRYQKRKPEEEEGNETAPATSEAEEKQTPKEDDKVESSENKDAAVIDVDDDKENGSNDSDNDSSNGGDSDNSDSDEEDNETAKTPSKEGSATKENKKEAESNSSDESSDDTKEDPSVEKQQTETANTDSKKEEDMPKPTATADGKVDPSDPIWDLLSKLASKQKRTFSRKVDREGPTVLEEVRNEVEKLLSGDTDDKKRSLESGTDGGPKKKKTKKGKDADWSKLPAEERLRREEQRRKQQEAAERRARGEDKTPGFKHPLNSERRRANRRKPKFKKQSEYKDNAKVEWNASGFHHRRQAKQGSQSNY